MKRDEDMEEEGEAETSSKEEEFLAICKLRGVGSAAPVAIQLKAIEAEYHSLKEAGQTHKAEHVQGLHAWKSKKALEVYTYIIYNHTFMHVPSSFAGKSRLLFCRHRESIV